jgi:hypothetical protein
MRVAGIGYWPLAAGNWPEQVGTASINARWTWVVEMTNEFLMQPMLTQSDLWPIASRQSPVAHAHGVRA